MPRKVNRPDDPWVLFAWQYLKDPEKNEMLRTACRRVIRSKHWRDAVSIDEAMGEVADRLPDIMRCYDSKKGSLDGHVVVCCKMYVHKHCRLMTQGPRAVRQGRVKVGQLPEELRERAPRNGHAGDRVQELLEHPEMPRIYAWLLEAYYVEALTVSEIAEVLDKKKAQVRQWLAEALDAARYCAAR